MAEKNRCNYKMQEVEGYMSADVFIKYLVSNYGGIIDWNLLKLQEVSTEASELNFLPFREKPCSISNMCCGMCTKRCSKRCVQDLLHRCHIINIQIDAALHRGEKLTTSMEMFKVEVSNVNTSYKKLCYLVGDILNGNEADREMHRWNYSCVHHMVPSKKNPDRLIKATRPEDGAYLLEWWPKSGLCPHCTPRTLVSLIGRRDKLDGFRK